MSDGEKHAILSPSSADRWMICLGSVRMEQGIEDVESEYATEGTQAHRIASEYLSSGAASDLFGFDDDDLRYILNYTDKIKELSKGHTLLVEQKVPLGHVTLEKDAEGTSDAVILYRDGETLAVDDFKFGMGVKIYARKNRQMMLYALGALHKYEVLGTWKRIIMRIHQPRLEHFDEWECTREELEEFADEVRFRAQFVWRLLRGEVKLRPAEDLVPTEKGCMWCKAKATCPALAAHTMSLLADDFEAADQVPTNQTTNIVARIETIDNDKLAWFMQNLGLVEDWVKAVRGRVESELLAGRAVPGFKIVQGKKGNRKWQDETIVEQTLKTWHLKKAAIYKTKILSVAEAEKVFKKNPERWAKLQELITQSEGQPSVAPFTDPRPALELGAREDDFEAVEG